MKRKNRYSLPFTLERLLEEDPSLLAFFPKGLPQRLPFAITNPEAEIDEATRFFLAHKDNVPNILVVSLQESGGLLCHIEAETLVDWLPVWMVVELGEERGLVSRDGKCYITGSLEVHLQRSLESGVHYLKPSVVLSFLEEMRMWYGLSESMEKAFLEYMRTYFPPDA